MFIFTLSTPDHANCFVSLRTHKNLLSAWAKHKEDHALYWVKHGKPAKFIGTIVNSKLVK